MSPELKTSFILRNGTTAQRTASGRHLLHAQVSNSTGTSEKSRVAASLINAVMEMTETTNTLQTAAELVELFHDVITVVLWRKGKTSSWLHAGDGEAQSVRLFSRGTSRIFQTRSGTSQNYFCDILLMLSVK